MSLLSSSKTDSNLIVWTYQPSVSTTPVVVGYFLVKPLLCKQRRNGITGTSWLAADELKEGNSDADLQPKPGGWVDTCDIFLCFVPHLWTQTRRVAGRSNRMCLCYNQHLAAWSGLKEVLRGSRRREHGPWQSPPIRHMDVYPDGCFFDHEGRYHLKMDSCQHMDSS